MRILKEKPLAVIAILLVVALFAALIFFFTRERPEVLYGPPDLYVTLDAEPVFVQEAYHKWHARHGFGTMNGTGGSDRLPSADDEIAADSGEMIIDFGAYPPQSLNVSYSTLQNHERKPLQVENGKVELIPGSVFYHITAEWQAEKYSGMARYNILINAE